MKIVISGNEYSGKLEYKDNIYSVSFYSDPGDLNSIKKLIIEEDSGNKYSLKINKIINYDVKTTIEADFCGVRHKFKSSTLSFTSASKFPKLLPSS